MVYCSECGTKNEESAEICVKCGAKLKMSKTKSLEKSIEEGAEEFGKRAEAWGKSFAKRPEEECFGLPHGGTIIGLIIGIIIIVVGLLSMARTSLRGWPVLTLILGALILGGAIYSLTRKR